MCVDLMLALAAKEVNRIHPEPRGYTGKLAACVLERRPGLGAPLGPTGFYHGDYAVRIYPGFWARTPAKHPALARAFTQAWPPGPGDGLIPRNTPWAKKHTILKMFGAARSPKQWGNTCAQVGQPGQA